MTFSTSVSTYLRKFGYSSTTRIASNVDASLRLSIVVPAYNEELSLLLNSLASCPLQNAQAVELIIVLNYPEDAPASVRDKHQQQWEQGRRELKNGLKVHWLPAFELPRKKAGVGLARKIGMDESLRRFGEIDYNGLIVCLDADCSVSENYLESLLEAEKQGVNGLSIYYEHPLELEDSVHKQAIVNYEIFLRYYAHALNKANYPFPFQTVGSSMAARAKAYIKAGGMNKRKAGEDFYFLHQIFPQGLFRTWTHCTVYPSPRLSERVPFGTGKAMLASLGGEKDYSQLYNPELFRQLGNWLSKPEFIYHHQQRLWPPYVRHFLEVENYGPELKDLIERSKNRVQFERNFFFWFNGFKVLKYLHANQRQAPDVKNIKACSDWLGTMASMPEDLLNELRALERKAPFAYL